MNVDQICRCCLTNDGPLLTIYDGGTVENNKYCLADMIKEITKVKPEKNDKLPDKACLICIKEINQSYVFKMKCENSNRTLQQLFCYNVKVELQCPVQNLKSEDFTQYMDITRSEDKFEVDSFEIAPLESVNSTQDEFDGSSSVKAKNTTEASMLRSWQSDNMATTSARRSISSPNPTHSNENPSHFENHRRKQLSTNDITENPHNWTDSETNSSDTIEFIPNKPPDYIPIVVLDDDESFTTNDKVGVNEAEVEYTFKNVSSPQWVPEEESYLSVVNEDLSFANVFRLRNEIMEDLNKNPSHVENSSGSRYQCAICKEEFPQKIYLTNHLESHEKPYSCIFCHNLFDDYSTLRLHLMEHGTNSVKNTRKRSKRTQPTTKRSGKRTKLKQYDCEFCPMSFHAVSILNNHRRTHTGERPYKCKYCDRNFVQSSTLSNHEKTHTGEKRFKCQYCDKTFVQSGTRTMHERIHTGERPFKCKYCNRGFIQLGVKQRHETTHKCTSVECPQCDIKFLSKNAVIEHIRTQHTQ